MFLTTKQGRVVARVVGKLFFKTCAIKAEIAGDED